MIVEIVAYTKNKSTKLLIGLISAAIRRAKKQVCGIDAVIYGPRYEMNEGTDSVKALIYRVSSKPKPVETVWSTKAYAKIVR